MYEEYQLHGFSEEYEPDFIKFYEELLKQPEEEAKNLALVIERYVLRWYAYFCKENKYRN